MPKQPSALDALEQPLAYKAIWELAEQVMACRIIVVAKPLDRHEFAGMVAGYAGQGQSYLEPFHVTFERVRATRLLIGDRDVLTNKSLFAECWPPRARAAVFQARKLLRGLIIQDAQNLWVAGVQSKKAPLVWLAHDPGTSQSQAGSLDERVWACIGAHIGTPVGDAED